MTSKILLAAAATALIATPAISAEAAYGEDTAIENAKAKKPKKITDRRHPDYVRCRSQPVIGSLAKKRRVCMTNKEWVAFNKKGNDRSREMVDDLQSGMNASN